MSPAEQYRKLAAELTCKAGAECNEDVAAELSALARSYVRLAEQADQNGETDLWFEFGAKPALDGGEA
jgi:hypothetical protein